MNGITDLTIRRARRGDTPTIVRFNVALAEESEGLELDPLTVEAGVTRMFADPALGRYFLAVSNQGEPLGQLMITTEWSDWRNCMIWWLQSVYTASEHRGRGVFRSLCEFVLGEARAADCRLRLYVERDNAQAISAYRALGFLRCGYDVMEYEPPA